MKSMFRRALELFSRRIVFKRKLPALFGGRSLLVTPDSQLKYFKFGQSAFDLELLETVQREIKNGMVVWDIGANVGVFSFAAAGIAENVSVLAVEPDIVLANLILKSTGLKENQGLKIDVLPIAVSDQTAIGRLVIAARGRASNALQHVVGRSQMGGSRHEVCVPMFSLDDLLNDFTPPDFVKIDVEGAELLVLKGANRLLSDIRPTLYLEVGQSQTEEVTNLLEKFSYAIYDGSSGDADRPRLEVCAFNTIAIPE